MSLIVVTGAGGFIGSHLVDRLAARGDVVRGVDRTPPLYRPTRASEFVIADLRDPGDAEQALRGADVVYALAANMGGIGWTHTRPAEILSDNLRISTNTVEAARLAGVRKLVYTSSACVYPNYLQTEPNSAALAEATVWPADPDMQYGWEKLTSEILCQAYAAEYGMDIRIARLHAIYGPFGTFDGPRAKSLSMLCTKVASLPPEGGDVEVWGDGTQTRSYCYVDDCVEGLLRLADSVHASAGQPVNIGSDYRVTIAELVDRIAATAGKTVSSKFLPDRPVGPLGRCSDNSRIKALLGWEPEVSLDAGLKSTYEWIVQQVHASRAAAQSGLTPPDHLSGRSLEQRGTPVV